ncbi:MAG TPA: PQQ-binding-like beta-propeller repeat protein, partial [Pirellulaceae bacterium]|nr:PQQ-binding-like beta-propeller repeat protein [Pirellulaceae bacterium]
MSVGSRWFALLALAAFTVPLFAADWPQWRGPNRDDVSTETNLQPRWPADGPSRLWLSDQAGIGYSGFSVVGDTLYTMGADDQTESVIAINVANGDVKWSTPISERLKNGYGDGPRCTPTIEGHRIYALGGRGALACLNTADGAEIWTVQMRDFGGRTPGWG